MAEFEALRDALGDLNSQCDQVERTVTKFIPDYSTVRVDRAAQAEAEKQCHDGSQLCQEIGALLNEGLRHIRCDKCDIVRGFERQQWLAPRCGHLLCRRCMADLFQRNKEAETFISHCPVNGDTTTEAEKFLLPRIVTSASKVKLVGPDEDEMRIITSSSKVVHIKDDNHNKLQPDLETVPNILDQSLLSKYPGWIPKPRDNPTLVQILDVIRPLLLTPVIEHALPNKVVIFSRNDR